MVLRVVWNAKSQARAMLNSLEPMTGEHSPIELYPLVRIDDFPRCIMPVLMTWPMPLPSAFSPIFMCLDVPKFMLLPVLVHL